MARRSRTRSRTRLRYVLLVLALVVLTALIISGLVSSARSNKGYVTVMNHSVAAQANSISLAQERNGVALSSLMGELHLLTRAQITRAFDDLVYRTTVEAQAASIMPGVGPSHDAGTRYALIQTERAQGVASLRKAVDGLLGLQPYPVVGAPPSAQVVIAPLNQSQASAIGASGGALIERADNQMRSLRLALAASPGHVHLHNTTFVADPSIFSVASMDALFAQLRATASLDPVISPALVGVTFTPSPLPTTTTSGVVALGPTTTLSATVVVANHGNAPARGVIVTMNVSPASAQGPSSARATGSVAPASSAALTTSTLTVVPGMTISVTISVVTPGASAPISRTYRVSIAQATPSPPTTAAG